MGVVVDLGKRFHILGFKCFLIGTSQLLNQKYNAALILASVFRPFVENMSSFIDTSLMFNEKFS